ncbi:MAG TPA: LPS export ABC transporter periplasmic protein LptC [Bacteroidales bacterium]|nr:LPS export ABC transporter periplasmic protein LptC [Bacteroidales bacterium]
MKCILFKYIKSWLIAVVPATALFLYSCENNKETIPRLDLLSLPSQSVKEFETIYSDSGKIELIMRSPLMEQFDNSGDPYYEFPQGIHVDVFDGQDEPTGSVTSKYAKYTRSANLWELKDSVVVINEKNDMLETEVLYWDQGKDLIYSDRFVRFTNEDQIVMGTGFESDPHLRKRKIRKVSATIYLKDEK